MEGQTKNNTVLLTVIGIATLLIVVVGATFAYFAAQTITDNTSTVTIKAASDGTVITSGGFNELADVGENIYPKATAWQVKNFTIKQAGVTNATGSQKVTITLTVSANQFAGVDLDATTAGVQDLGQYITYTWTEKNATESLTHTPFPAATAPGNSVKLLESTFARTTGIDIDYTFRVYFDADNNINQNTGTNHNLTYQITYTIEEV